MVTKAEIKYNIWTSGCQMNKSDSEMLAGQFDSLGITPNESYADSDIIVLNTCVVRQSAENNATSLLEKIKLLKMKNQEKILVVMGCMVGPNSTKLSEDFPYVDVWARPQDFNPIINLVSDRFNINLDGCLSNVTKKPGVTKFISVTHGCDKFCTFCIIPYRRGREKSRPVEELLDEISLYVDKGVKEVTLLGQNIDSYGHDLRPRKDLADLIEKIHPINGLDRIRFLTSHPNDMSLRIIETIRDLPKVCKNINLPFQAGDDVVLSNMRRGYTVTQFIKKIDLIKNTIPDVTLTSDLIVGFPGETRTQFENSMKVLKLIEFDKVHVSGYSTREGTVASRKLIDDITIEEKKSRIKEVNVLQEEIQYNKNNKLIGTYFDVLIEGHKRGDLFGRAMNDKIVYIDFDGERNINYGETLGVEITKSTPWSLRGTLIK